MTRPTIRAADIDTDRQERPGRPALPPPTPVGFAGTSAVYARRASVRMPLTSKQALLALAFGLALVAAFRLLSGAAEAGGVPAPHAVVSAVLCLAGAVVTDRWRAVAVARAQDKKAEATAR
ncbi:MULTISPECIES: hypothetical protein [Streptomyces]|uniref:hypothetical protein n=1 Tax=Streptomyces TaxID=1883 RepID=UPI001F3BB5FA|nr:hypothetical protein [Streptomyces noursei]MCE4946289.1 hypothetical protein [Streptomyces noursei]